LLSARFFYTLLYLGLLGHPTFVGQEWGRDGAKDYQQISRRAVS
jgi:hypothetical protein